MIPPPLETHKVLGITYDHPITWSAYIPNTTNSVSKYCNVLKLLSYPTYGCVALYALYHHCYSLVTLSLGNKNSLHEELPEHAGHAILQPYQYYTKPLLFSSIDPTAI